MARASGVGNRKNFQQTREASARTEELLRSSGIGSWTWEIASDAVHGDEQCAALFGLPADLFPRTIDSLTALLHPQDGPRVREEIAACGQSANEYDTEFRVLWPGGATRALAIRGRVYRTESGEPASLTAVCRDVTVRRQLEEELRAARVKLAEESKFRSLVETAPDAMVVLNRHGKILLINKQIEKLFGYEREELLGQSIELLIPERFRRERAAQRSAFFADPDAEAARVPVEVFYLRRDGTEFPAELSPALLPTESGALFSCAIRDVTQRRAVEDQLRRSRAVLQSLFESLPGLFLVLTPDLKIVAASDAYLAATMTARGDLLGRHIFDVFPDNPNDPAATGSLNVRASFYRVLRNAAPDTMPILKYDIRGSDGVFEERFWSPINSPVLGEDGRIEYLIHRVEDVTDFVRRKADPASDGSLRQRMELMEAEIFQNSQQLHAANQQLHDAVYELMQTKAEAVAANKAKSTFLSTMSHEIRTPMNAILGYAQLMLRDPKLMPESKENLRIICRSGEHLLALINDVLDMSKIEAGRTELNPTVFNLPRLLHDLEAMFRLRAGSKGLRFKLLSDGEDVPYIVADEAKIRQVLINLLGNAVKFTEIGQVRLHVTVEKTAQPQEGDEAGDELSLTARIEDTGPGISIKDQVKLFQPFSQVRSGPDSLKGTGLGLAISHKYARLMRGDITVASSQGNGSAFTFRIPVGRGDAGVGAAQSTRRRAIRIRMEGAAPKILIVDDHPENRDWLTQLLTSVGYTVRDADNGETALRNWREWNPNLILMDVHMPVMDGLEATRRIKADPNGKETIVVALTASALDEDRRTVAESGADDFVAKPCREEELLETMGTLLKIKYDYEQVNSEAGAVAAPDLTVEKLRALPRGLLEEIRDATLSGNKKLLDKSIVRVTDAGDSESAAALQQLADKYDYDALNQLLEEACRQ